MFSVAIIARDAEECLAKCLESVAGVTDDVVVVIDTRTTDRTEEVARKFASRIYYHQFINFSDQKNFAAGQTKYPWVLSLDADEWVTPEFIAGVNRAIAENNYAAFSFPRINYLFGKPIFHTGWDPETDRHVWMFQKNSARWEGSVHEHVVVTGNVGRLSFPKYHTNYTTAQEFILKMNNYTGFESQSRKFHLPLVFLYPVWKFVRHYFIFQGFLDGWHGLYISYLMAVYGLTVYIKAWEKGQLSG